MTQLRIFTAFLLVFLVGLAPALTLAGCAPTNNYKFAPGAGPVFDVKAFGAKGDSSTNDYAAVAEAITAASNSLASSAVVYFPAGTYVIGTGLTIPVGVTLRGTSGYGQGSWSQLKFTGAGDFITYDGSGSVGGGRLEDLILSRGAASGGNAIKLYATSTASRPGEFVISNVIVSSYDGVQTWARGLHVDGTAANDVGNKGVRTIYLSKFRVADVSTAGESIYLNQATHVTFSHVQVDAGPTLGAAGIKTAGETTNLVMSSVICNGDMTLAGTLSNVKVVGFVAGDLNIGASVVGADIMANGATLTIADGAVGTARGYWTGTVTNGNDAKFRVINANDNRTYIGNQVAAGGYNPSTKAAVYATTSLGSVFNAFPLDSGTQTAGFYAYNPATTNAMLAEISTNRAKIGSPNATPVDLMYGATAKITLGPNGAKVGDTTAPTARLHLTAGTTAAETAPLKMTSGPLNTTPEAGAIEFLTNSLYYTGTDAARRTLAALESANTFTVGQLIGGSGITNALHLFRDATAGASSNIVQLKVGNASTDHGEFDTRFVNGTNQEGLHLFLPRNTAGTSNFQAGKLGWAKNGGSDTADMDLLTGSARLYQEGGTGHTGINNNTPNEALDVTGNIQLNTAGNGIKIKTGSNATMGRAVLVGGTLTVSTTKATSTANIILTTQVPGGTTGTPVVASRVNGTSFTIESRDGAGALQTLDTSTIAWVIFEEAP